MPVFYQGRPAQVWRVDPNAPYPDWVATALKKNELIWKEDNKLQVLIPSLFPHWHKSSRYWGYGIYALANPGDYIDLTNERLLSPKPFIRDYQKVDGF